MARSGVLTYKSPEEMQEKIDAYFEECKGQPLLDDKGAAVLDKFGYPITVDSRPLTVTGLALALGFTTRQSLLNYQAKSKKYQEIIERAKLKIENYAEMRLYDKDGANGAKFNLQNNFRHWDADKAKSDEGKGPAINIICDIPRAASKSVGDGAEQAQADAFDPQIIQDAIKAIEGETSKNDG